MNSVRLSLRKIHPDDHAKVHEGLSDPEVTRHYGVSYDSLEATREQMDWFRELEDHQKGQWWAVCSLDGSTFLGAGGFHDWDPIHRKAEIGFWLLREHWGKGYMSEAMPLICQYGFEQMNLHRIEGYVDSGNKNCKRGLAKLGFIHEGCMRNCEWKHDQFLSIDIYSKLVTD